MLPLLLPLQRAVRWRRGRQLWGPPRMGGAELKWAWEGGWGVRRGAGSGGGRDGGAEEREGRTGFCWGQQRGSTVGVSSKGSGGEGHLWSFCERLSTSLEVSWLGEGEGRRRPRRRASRRTRASEGYSRLARSVDWGVGQGTGGRGGTGGGAEPEEQRRLLLGDTRRDAEGEGAVLPDGSRTRSAKLPCDSLPPG